MSGLRAGHYTARGHTHTHTHTHKHFADTFNTFFIVSFSHMSIAPLFSVQTSLSTNLLPYLSIQIHAFFVSRSFSNLFVQYFVRK